MKKNKSRIISLLTDFGVVDPYVAAMKGVILGINPEAHIIDISHHIESHDIHEASFILLTSYRYFPPGTIHLVVIDPGVGSERRPLLIQTERYFFIAPDNGVLSFPLSREKVKLIVEITKSKYFLKEVSSTFHGRDIFSPVAAWLSRGAEARDFGSVVKDYHKIAFPQLKRSGKRQWQAEVFHIDKFGNIISNIDRSQWRLFQVESSASSFSLTIGKHKIESLVDNYQQGKNQKLFALFGSSNFLEISSYCRSAARIIKAKRGDKIKIALL